MTKIARLPSLFGDDFVKPSENDAPPLTNLSLEISFLAGLLFKPETLEYVSPCFSAEHLHWPFHQDIFRTIAAVRDDSRGAFAVIHALALNDPESAEYITSLMSSAVTWDSRSTKNKSELLTDLWKRRRMMDITYEAQHLIGRASGPSSCDPILAQVLNDIDAVASLGRQGGHSSITMLEAVDRAVAAGERAAAGKSTALHTGMKSIDRRLGGMEGGAMYVLAGRPGMGKAQPMDSKILRFDGTWARMSDLRLGDKLASVDGAPSLVSGIFPRGTRQVYTVTFSDGRTSQVCGDHLWEINYRDWSEPRVLATDHLIEMLKCARYKNRLSIPVVSGHFGNSSFPLDPYVLGVLLGDGNLSGITPRLSTADTEILDEMKCRLGPEIAVRKISGTYDYSLSSRFGEQPVYEPGYADWPRRYPLIYGDDIARPRPRIVHTLRVALHNLGLMGCGSQDKFIPSIYMSASRGARLDLLRGLMDTDGWAEAHGSVRFTSCSLSLATGVQDLVRSLGGVCSIARKKVSFTKNGIKKPGLDAWICKIRHPHAETFFLLGRKAERAKRGHNTTVRLNIEKIEPCSVEPVQCISVTHPSRLYVTDDYIVTHNTALAAQIAYNVAHEGVGVGFVSLEMQAAQIGRRVLAWKSGMSQRVISQGAWTEYQAGRIVEARKDMAMLPLTIDDQSGANMAQIALKARAAQRKHGLGLLIVDHLHIVSQDAAATRMGATWAVSQISNGLKRLAKDMGIPVLALAQLKRLESREDKRPTMEDLRQSGEIEQDAEAIMLLYREEYYLSKNPPAYQPRRTSEQNANQRSQWEEQRKQAAGKAEIIFAKVRDAEPGTEIMGFDGPTVSFHEFAHEEMQGGFWA